MIPRKLKPGDEIRVVAPSNSLGIISEETRKIANQRFDELGLKLTFSDHCEEMNEFLSSSVEHRVQDLHDAFTDPQVNGIFTVIGGHNSNQLLSYLDYDLIRNHPKVLCGYSDTTALQNAIHAKTGLVTYSGPAYSTLGMSKGIDYSMDYLSKCLFHSEPYALPPPEQWSDDAWYLDQENRTFYAHEGIKVANQGTASGKLIGGNLCTFNLLNGTEFKPSLNDSVLFIEDDYLTFPEDFDRDLQALIHQQDFSGVRGILIGKFQKHSKVSDEKLLRILSTKKELSTVPILYNLGFGHTTPLACLPIGGSVAIDTASDEMVRVIAH